MRVGIIMYVENNTCIDARGHALDAPTESTTYTGHMLLPNRAVSYASRADNL